eukprot:10629794-Lingulodinium_polyedra.AAC.1
MRPPLAVDDGHRVLVRRTGWHSRDVPGRQRGWAGVGEATTGQRSRPSSKPVSDLAPRNASVRPGLAISGAI